MGDSLADAAEGPWPMKASASDDQQVDLVGEVGERFDGTAGVDDGVGESCLIWSRSTPLPPVEATTMCSARKRSASA